PGCEVASGLAQTTQVHYSQGDSAPGSGPNPEMICNYGADRKHTPPQGDDFAGIAVTVDFCGPPPPAPDSRETGNYNTYDCPQTVFYKHWLVVGKATLRIAMYTDKRSD